MGDESSGAQVNQKLLLLTDTHDRKTQYMKTIITNFAVSALFTFALLCICAVVADPTLPKATPELQPTVGVEVAGKAYAMKIPHFASSFRRNIIQTKPVVVRATNVVVGSARKAVELPYMTFIKSDIVGINDEGRTIHKLPKYNRPKLNLSTRLPTNAQGIKHIKF